MRGSKCGQISFQPSRTRIPEFRCGPTPHIHGRRIFAAIDCFNGNQDAHLGSDLNHLFSLSRQARSRLLQSGGVLLFHRMRILLPVADSTSMTHSSNGAGTGEISSTKVGLGCLGIGC
jgi:hypothetical protein